MEGPRWRAKTSPIDGNLCVIDMRDLAVGSSLARKRKSEGGRDEDDERRSLERKTQYAVEHVEDAGMSDWSAAPPRTCTSRSKIANGTRVRVASGRYTGLIGVAVDVSGVQAKVELPQPSRLETLYVQMEQLEATAHRPTKAGRCTTRTAKTPASKKRIWDSFPSPTSDDLEPVVAAAAATATGSRASEARSAGDLPQRQGSLPTAASLAESFAYTFSCSGSGSCCLPLGDPLFQAIGRGAEASAAGRAATATSCSRVDGNDHALAHPDKKRGDLGGGGGSGSGGGSEGGGSRVSFVGATSQIHAGQRIRQGIVDEAEWPVAAPASGGACNSGGSPALGQFNRGRTRRRDDCDTLSYTPRRRSCCCCSSSISSSSNSSNSCSSGSDSEGDGYPCEDLENASPVAVAPAAAGRQMRRSPDHRRRQQQQQQLRSEGKGDEGGSSSCPNVVPPAITSPDLWLPSSPSTTSARPPAAGQGVTGVSTSGRSWPRPRPPGLTLGVGEVDTEVCAGGLTKATQVLENLWVGGQEVTGDKCGLQREGVTHIVNCSIRLANFYPRDFSYHRVSWADENGQDMDPPVLEAAFRHIDAARRQGKACLVHCKAGTSRSCSLVLGYLMQLGEGMSLIAAFELCQAKRRQCNPDKYFLERLSEYEERLFGQTSVSLDGYHRGDIATSLSIGSSDVATPAGDPGGRALSLLQ